MSIGTGTSIACGLPGEEMLLAALFAADADADAVASRQLLLLRGESYRWTLQASSDAVIYRLPLAATCAAVRTAPALIGGSPLPVRALLLSLLLASLEIVPS